MKPIACPAAARPWSRLAAVTLATLLGLGALSASAQTLDRSSTDIIRSLAPSPARAPQSPRADARPPLQVHAPDGTLLLIRVDRSRTLDFDVFFPFDSAELTPQARRSLAALGAALASPDLAGASYLLAGHTDARGTASHNETLSYRRALAVRNYLVSTFPIDPARLYVAGFGSRFLRVPDAPEAALNRRVEVTLVVDR